MTRDFSNDDDNMLRALNENIHARASYGIDQFTPKITPRGNPNRGS